MPLFVDDEQVEPKSFALSLGIKEDRYNRLVKKPSFKMDDSQVVKKKTITSNLLEPPVKGIKASFWFKDKDGMTKRLRYAKSRSPKVEGGVMTYKYDPAYINIKGILVAFVKEEDKALFMYLRPENPSSPFAGMRKGFTFIDPVSETLKAANDMSSIQKALTHATEAEEEELVIIAKGLKILLSDEYEIEELRVRMQQLAINPATNKRYLDGMNDEMVRIEGRIYNLIDKKIVRLDKLGNNAKQWVWTGDRDGERIGGMITNPNDDPKKLLVRFIKEDLGAYIDDLRNSTVLLQSDRKARKFLAEEKTNVPEHLTNINQTSNSKDLKEEVFDFQSAKAFIDKKGYPKTPGNVKILENAVADGDVGYGNVDDFLVKLYEKK